MHNFTDTASNPVVTFSDYRINEGTPNLNNYIRRFFIIGSVSTRIIPFYLEWADPFFILRTTNNYDTAFVPHNEYLRVLIVQPRTSTPIAIRESKNTLYNIATIDVNNPLLIGGLVSNTHELTPEQTALKVSRYSNIEFTVSRIIKGRTITDLDETFPPHLRNRLKDTPDGSTLVTPRYGGYNPLSSQSGLGGASNATRKKREVFSKTRKQK